MQVVILAGGMGTRITEESHLKPKPMIEIGGKPILWHIMKIYEHYGFNEFVICLGYKGHLIKEYFVNYHLNNSDVYVDTSTNETKVLSNSASSFKVSLIDTGLDTMTAGRIKRIQKHIKGDDFFLTYGDGLADINLRDELRYHKEHGKLCTMTIVQPEGKFGALKFDESNNVTNFKEKPRGDGAFINGGFFVLSRRIFDYLNTDDFDSVMWEQEPMEYLTKRKQLKVYKHSGFWKSMDSMKDRNDLEKLWSESPRWKIW